MSSSSSNPEVRSERHGLKQKQTMRTLSCVTLDQVVGKGTFGLVYKATEIDTGDTVALKKIFMENEHHGFPITVHISFTHTNHKSIFLLISDA